MERAETVESVLLVPVPEVDRVTSVFRRQFSSAARDGIGPHITLLYPFKDPARVSDEERQALARILGSVDSFDYELQSTAWFGDSVLYLAPTCAERFGALTDALVAELPDRSPYGGVCVDNVAHLTVADEGTLDELQQVERRVAERLPITATATEVV